MTLQLDLLYLLMLIHFGFVVIIFEMDIQSYVPSRSYGTLVGASSVILHSDYDYLVVGSSVKGTTLLL